MAVIRGYSSRSAAAGEQRPLSRATLAGKEAANWAVRGDGILNLICRVRGTLFCVNGPPPRPAKIAAPILAC